MTYLMINLFNKTAITPVIFTESKQSIFSRLRLVLHLLVYQSELQMRLQYCKDIVQELQDEACIITFIP